MMLGITLQTWWVQVNDEPGPELILSCANVLGAGSFHIARHRYTVYSTTVVYFVAKLMQTRQNKKLRHHSHLFSFSSNDGYHRLRGKTIITAVMHVLQECIALVPIVRETGP